jgi:CRP/FNR family transcriptional regulator, cyclic AMP receptor protein
VQLSLLDALSPTERELVSGRLVRRSFKRGQVVFNDGDAGDCLHLVAVGRFAVVMSTPDGIEITLRVVHPNEFFGELALVHPDNHRTGRVVAIEPAETSVLYRRDLDDLRAHHPGVDRLLVVALADRIKRMSEQSVEAMLPAEQRVWRRLAVLADAYSREPIRMSQEDLARIAGTVRQTVNRALTIAESAGAVGRRRGTITVVDRAALQRLIES